jgi:myo-inositol 2-dehydrogenase/D-chiro-inositol 1-dehydrogenase
MGGIGLSDTLKLGIVGCGWVTEFYHLPALQKVGNVEVLAVSDEDREPLARVAEKSGAQRRHDDYKALLEDPEVDAVFIWLPADCQVEVASEVLAAGKHLIIDKPLVFDLEAWDRVIEQAAHAGRKIPVVGFPRRWHPILRGARTVVGKGLGYIEHVRTVLTGRNAERRTIEEVGARHQVRGLLYEFGIHHFDVLQTLVPDDVEWIHAVGSPDEMTYVVTAQLSGGAMLSSTFTEGESHNDEIEIYGRAGRLHAACYRFDGLEFFPSELLPGDMKMRAAQLVNIVKTFPRALMQARRGGDFDDSYRVSWQHAVDAIRTGGRPECSLVEARGALRLFLAARQSLELGEPVRLIPE